jgi:hypothetical protein
MKAMYYLFKFITAVVSVLALYFSAHFWLGSKKEWDKAVNERLGEFFLARLAFTLVVGFLFLLLNVYVDWLFRKSIQRGRHFFWIELLTIVFLSIAFVGYTMII